MSHEIEKHDHVVLTKEKAWHGLGTVVEEAPNAMNAMVLAKLDWTVSQRPVWTEWNGEKTEVEGWKANYRDDTNEMLSMVGSGYRVIQNRELAEFCDGLVEGDEGVKIESAGSIRNGQKVWFLIQSGSFDATGQGDEVRNYLLVSNGHDGRASMNVMPTDIRVVCSNTLHAVVPDGKERRKQKQRFRHGISIYHSKNAEERMIEVQNVIKKAGMAFDLQRERITTLVAKDVNHELCKRFFLECYARDFGAINMDPATSKESRAKDKAMDHFKLFEKRFEMESNVAGSNAWNMFNAYSGFVQHDRKTRKESDSARDSRLLFGDDVTRADKAFELALTI